ncbi:MAG: SMC-Scp complex subunit ScpB [Clostridiales bacterium]|nr:SMC-Scp complex subunit ScpB [Clostridiales bacterium]
MSELKNQIEAILFIAGDSLHTKDIAAGLTEDVSEVKKQIAILSDEYDLRNAGIQIIWIKDSVQMSSRNIYAEAIDHVLAPLKTTSLTKSAIETLSIIAYKQPITRTEVAEIRGVRSDYSINVLRDRGLIEESGKKNALGNPTLFSTTEFFLREFNMNSLDNLPSVAEIEIPEDINEDQESEEIPSNKSIDDEI